MFAGACGRSVRPRGEATTRPETRFLRPLARFWLLPALLALAAACDDSVVSPEGGGGPPVATPEAGVAASHASGSPLSVGPEADSASTGDTLGTAFFDGDTLWRDGAGPVADSAVLWQPGEASGPVVVEVDGVLRLGLGEATPAPGGAPRIPVAEAVGPPGIFYYSEVFVISRSPPEADTTVRPDLPRPRGTTAPPGIRGSGNPPSSDGTADLASPPEGSGPARLARPDSGTTGKLTPPTFLALTVEEFTLTFVALEPDGTRRPLALPLAAREEPGGPVRILDASAAEHGLMVRWEAGDGAGGGFVADLDLDCPVEVEGHCVPAPPIDNDRIVTATFASIGNDFPDGPFGHLEVTAMAADACPSDPFFDDSSVREALETLVERSNFDAAQTERREQFAFIVEAEDGFTVDIRQNQSDDPCSVEGNPVPPDDVVAWVHTHPFEGGEQIQPGVCERHPQGGEYVSGPSELDRQTLAFINEEAGRSIPGIIINPDGTVRFEVRDDPDFGPRVSDFEEFPGCLTDNRN